MATTPDRDGATPRSSVPGSVPGSVQDPPGRPAPAPAPPNFAMVAYRLVRLERTAQALAEMTAAIDGLAAADKPFLAQLEPLYADAAALLAAIRQRQQQMTGG